MAAFSWVVEGFGSQISKKSLIPISEAESAVLISFKISSLKFLRELGFWIWKS
jgi:hypothetical protein